MTDSREALLEAAWQLVVESFGFEPSSDRPGKTVDAKILEQLKAADITARAGMTTGAFYNRWPNRESFLEDFLDYAISVDRSPTFAAIANEYGQFTDLPLIEQLERMAVINIASVSANPSFAIQTHLWSLMRGRPDIRERMDAMYKDFRDPMVPIYEMMLIGLGREIREPITMPQFSNIMVGLTEGMAMQIVAGGENAPTNETYVLALLSMLPALTRQSNDHRTIREVLAEEMDRAK